MEGGALGRRRGMVLIMSPWFSFILCSFLTSIDRKLLLLPYIHLNMRGVLLSVLAGLMCYNCLYSSV